MDFVQRYAETLNQTAFANEIEIRGSGITACVCFDLPAGISNRFVKSDLMLPLRVKHEFTPGTQTVY